MSKDTNFYSNNANYRDMSFSDLKKAGKALWPETGYSEKDYEQTYSRLDDILG